MPLDPQTGMYVYPDPETGEPIYTPYEPTPEQTAMPEPDFGLYGDVPEPAMQMPPDEIGVGSATDPFAPDAVSGADFAPPTTQPPPSDEELMRIAYETLSPNAPEGPGLLQNTSPQLAPGEAPLAPGIDPETGMSDPAYEAGVAAANRAEIRTLAEIDPVAAFQKQQLVEQERQQAEEVEAHREAQQAREELRARVESEIKEIGVMKPWHDRVGTPVAVASIIGGMLGGFLAPGRGGRNLFNEQLNRTIDRDMELQRQQINQRLKALQTESGVEMSDIDFKLRGDLAEAKLRSAAFYEVADKFNEAMQKAKSDKEYRDAMFQYNDAYGKAEKNKRDAEMHAAELEYKKAQTAKTLSEIKGTRLGGNEQKGRGVGNTGRGALVYNATTGEWFDPRDVKQTEKQGFSGKDLPDRVWVNRNIVLTAPDGSSSVRMLVSADQKKKMMDAWDARNNVNQRAQNLVSVIDRIEKKGGRGALETTGDKLKGILGLEGHESTELKQAVDEYVAYLKEAKNFGAALSPSEAKIMYGSALGRDPDKLLATTKLSDLRERAQISAALVEDSLRNSISESLDLDPSQIQFRQGNLLGTTEGIRNAADTEDPPVTGGRGILDKYQGLLKTEQELGESTVKERIDLLDGIRRNEVRLGNPAEAVQALQQIYESIPYSSVVEKGAAWSLLKTAQVAEQSARAKQLGDTDTSKGTTVESLPSGTLNRPPVLGE